MCIIHPLVWECCRAIGTSETGQRTEVELFEPDAASPDAGSLVWTQLWEIGTAGWGAPGWRFGLGSRFLFWARQIDPIVQATQVRQLRRVACLSIENGYEIIRVLGVDCLKLPVHTLARAGHEVRTVHIIDLKETPT